MQSVCLLHWSQARSISRSRSGYSEETLFTSWKETKLNRRRTLGGRRIDPRHLNTMVIEGWLSTCSRFHGVDCRPVYTGDLQEIRLVDVLNGEIDSYPGGDCDYVALSYVWGKVAQQSFRLGSTLGRLPETLEDAMTCVRILGKRYLWVDSLCIDQSDEKDKLNQLERLWSIYRGAYITIIALSGNSANAGISRPGHRDSNFCCWREIVGKAG